MLNSFILAVGNPPPVAGTPGSDFWGIFQGWEGINILALIVMLFFTTVLYMLAIGLNLPNVKRWVKSEYMQVLAGFLLVISVVAALDAAWEVSKIVTGQVWGGVAGGPGGPEDPFDAGKEYVLTAVDCERKAYATLYYMMMALRPLESSATDVAGVDAVTGHIVSPFVSLLSYIANRITWLLIFQYFIYDLFDIFQATMLTLFLPIGLILRVFPVSRGMGGLLISLAIGCYFVFPMSYVSIIAMQGKQDAYCTFMSDVAREVDSSFGKGTPCPDDLVKHFINREEFSTDPSKWTNLISQFGDNIAAMYVQAMFYPLVSLVITFTFIRSTSALFGADLAELGRGLLKLI